MVDFAAMNREHKRDRERGFRLQKQTVQRCPDCNIEAVFDGFVGADYCTEPHRPRVMMRIIKTHVARIKVGKDGQD